MPIFTIQAPDGRRIKIRADDQSTAVRGAQQWASQNPAEGAAPALQSDPGSQGVAVAPEGMQPGTREYADWAIEQVRAGKSLPQVGDRPPAHVLDTQSSIVDPMMQGLTFGFADEAAGALAGGVAAVQGGDFGETYDDVVDDKRAALDLEREVNPIGSLAAEIGGAIPTGALAGGQLAGLGKNLLQRMMSTGGVGAVQGAAYGYGSSEGETMEERGADALLSGAVGGAVGGAIPFVANKIAGAVRGGQQARALDAAAEAAPTSTELKSAATVMFEQATGGTPIAVNNNAYMRFMGGVTNIARKLRINTALDPKSVGLAEMMMSMADDVNGGGVAIDMKDLHILRQAAQKVAVSSEGRDAHFANQVIDQLDDFIARMGPDDVLGGADPSQAASALRNGISTWSRANKVALIEDAIERGRTAASGPQKGIANALRALKNKPEVWRRFSEAEQKAILDVVNGTPGSNLMKLVGTFGFGGNTATNGIGGAAGMALGQMAGGPIGMVAGPVIGSIAKNASEGITDNLAKRALGVAATEGTQMPQNIDPNQATMLEVLLRKGLLASGGNQGSKPLRIVVDGAGSYGP